MIGSVCRRAILRAAMVLCPFIGGCEGAHLYVAKNDGLAKQTKETYGKIDLPALANADRLNNDKLRDAELEAARRHFVYLRDFTIFGIIKHNLGTQALKLDTEKCASGGGIECELTRRLVELGAGDQKQIEEAVKLARTQRVVTAIDATPTGQILFSQKNLARFGWDPPPGCKDTDPIPDAVVARAGNDLDLVKMNIELLRQACADPTQPPPFSGLIADAMAKAMEAQAKTASIAKQAAEAKKKLADLSEEYTKLIAQAGPGAAQRRAEIIDDIKKVRKGVDAAGKAFELIGAQSEFAEQTIEAVDLLLSAGAGETIDAERLKQDPELARAAVIVQALPGLAADTGAAIDEYNAPPTASLLIAKQQASIDLDWLNTQKRFSESRQNLLAERLTALLAEVDLLNQVRISAANLERCEASSGTAPKPADAKALCQQYWLLALNQYSRAIVSGQGSVDATDVRGRHLDRLELIGATEYALRSWNNLIGPPVELLAAYHAGGIKPETLAELIIKAGALGFGGVVGGKLL